MNLRNITQKLRSDPGNGSWSYGPWFLTTIRTLSPRVLTVSILLERLGMAHPYPNEWCNFGV